MMKDLIERRLADPTLPMEEAFSQHLKEEELELPAGQFALFMNSMYAVDAYVRDYFRKAALDALLAGETAGYRIRGRLGKIFLRGRAQPAARAGGAVCALL